MGRHSEGGNASVLRSQIRQLIFDLNTQITVLTQVRDDIERVGSRLLMIKSHEQGVIIAGGALTNTCPVEIDEIIHGLQIHIASLSDFIDHII